MCRGCRWNGSTPEQPGYCANRTTQERGDAAVNGREVPGVHRGTPLGHPFLPLVQGHAPERIGAVSDERGKRPGYRQCPRPRRWLSRGALVPEVHGSLIRHLRSGVTLWPEYCGRPMILSWHSPGFRSRMNDPSAAGSVMHVWSLDPPANRCRCSDYLSCRAEHNRVCSRIVLVQSEISASLAKSATTRSAVFSSIRM